MSKLMREGLRSGEAYLDPTPDGREERWCVHDGNGIKGLWVIRGREHGRLLQMVAQSPHLAQRRALEIDDGCHRGYGSGF